VQDIELAADSQRVLTKYKFRKRLAAGAEFAFLVRNLWAAVFQKIFGGSTISGLPIAIRRVFVDPSPELFGADAHVRGDCDQIFEERTTALLVVLKTGVGRSEFHGLRVL
jgi:hypothetical protein